MATSIESIIAEFSERVIGQKRAAFSCCCGGIRCSAATATRIVPPTAKHANVAILWMVDMTSDAGEDRGYTVGLSDFVPMAEIKVAIAKHLGSVS